MNKPYTICLDPGHDKGISNPSPVVPGYYEGQRMWVLALLLKQVLENRNIKVILTKSHVDQAVALTTRGQMSQGCDLFLSLHSNAAGSESPNWVLGIHQVDDNCGEADEKSAQIAKLLSNAAAQLMGVPAKITTLQSTSDRDGNGYPDDYYGVLRGAHQAGTPGIILEHGFHTNEACTRWLLDDRNLQALAEKEASVIEAWLKGNSSLDFVRQLQLAIGAAPDGIAGPETLSKTPTLSMNKNQKHPAVKPVQQELHRLGYTQVGPADGIAGPKFDLAVKTYQRDHRCWVDGELTAQNKTWRCLLGLERL